MTEGAGGNADACHCQNEAQRPGVPAIETEQVEGGTPLGTVAPGFHAVRRFHRRLHAHGQQHRQVPQGTAQPLQQPRTFLLQHGLRLPDLAAILLKLWDEPQRHGDQQRRTGKGLAEQVQELIRGHDLLIAGEPHNDRAQGAAGHQTVAHGFQRVPQVIDGKKHGHAPMVE